MWILFVNINFWGTRKIFYLDENNSFVEEIEKAKMFEYDPFESEFAKQNMKLKKNFSPELFEIHSRSL